MPFAETLALIVQLLLVPVLVAGLGLAAYRAATYLTFHPRQFAGAGALFGWQGWLARRQIRLQSHLIVTLGPTLNPLSQVFEYLTPQKWVVHALQVLRPQLDNLIDEAISKNNSVLWENMPVTLKNRFYSRAHRQLPGVIDDIIEEVGDQSDSLIVLEHLFAIAGAHTPFLATRLLEHAATPYLGAARSRFFLCLFALMVPVAAAHTVWPHWWLLAAGIYASFCTSLWFRHTTFWKTGKPQHQGAPAEKRRTLARETCKREFALSVAPLIADELLTPRHWMTSVIDGPMSRKAYMIVKKHVSRLVENLSIRTFAQLTIGATGYVELKTALSTTVLSAMHAPFEDARFNQSRSARVTDLFGQKLLAMSDRDVKLLLAPAINSQSVLALVVAIPLALLTAYCIHWGVPPP